jgi:hypothetical protein
MPKIANATSADVCDGCGRQAYFIAANSKKKRCCEVVTKCPAFIAKAKSNRHTDMTKEELSIHMTSLSLEGNKTLAKLHNDPTFVQKKGQKISIKISEAGGRAGSNNAMYGKTHKPSSKTKMQQKACSRPQEFYESNLRRRIENGHIVPLDSKEPFEAYHQLVDKITRRSWLKEQNSINPKNLLRGNGYELDHIVSIVDGFRHNVPPEIIGHHANLRIIGKAENRSKHSRSDMDIAELVSKVNDAMNMTGNKNDASI